MDEDNEWYECPVCCYATNNYNRFLKHGEEHAKKENLLTEDPLPYASRKLYMPGEKVDG